MTKDIITTSDTLQGPFALTAAGSFMIGGSGAAGPTDITGRRLPQKPLAIDGTPLDAAAELEFETYS